MKVLILGIDGYIGWPLALHLLNKGYEVGGLDNYSRRIEVKNLRSNSLTPIAARPLRSKILRDHENFDDDVANVDMTDYYNLRRVIKVHKPDTIVHLAEQPSAPWSMKSPNHAADTQYDNVIGTLNLLWAMKECCPDAHLIKLGSMGEYGTPDCDIPEGKIPAECLCLTEVGNYKHKCPMASLPFPRSPNSFYHLSKVHDTHNIIFACKTWELSSTDIMQGIVYGLIPTEEELLTRFDYDECFGTIINRFCVQTILGEPLTIYGSGYQRRGFLHLKDSIQCLTVAIENPPEQGEYRTFNQFEKTWSINGLAQEICISAFGLLGIAPAIAHIPNPRNEAELHRYSPAHQKLHNLGYKPTTNIRNELCKLLEMLKPYKHKILPEVINPKINWR